MSGRHPRVGRPCGVASFYRDSLRTFPLGLGFSTAPEVTGHGRAKRLPPVEGYRSTSVPADTAKPGHDFEGDGAQRVLISSHRLTR